MTTSAFGLKGKEERVLKLLGEAYIVFSQLEVQHPDDLEEFKRAIHRCQDLVGVRVARRRDPEVWIITP